MTDQRSIALLRERRRQINQWLDEEAPYTEADQLHLDVGTPERAYWHHGYQAGLADAIQLLTRTAEKSRNGGTSI